MATATSSVGPAAMSSMIPPLLGRFRGTQRTVLRAAAPELGALLDALRRCHGRSVRRIRLLHRMYLDYPTGALCAAVRDASTYGSPTWPASSA